MYRSDAGWVCHYRRRPYHGGRRRGKLVPRIKEEKPLIADHCLILQTVLCVTFSEHFAEAMNTTTKLINFLRTSSCLQHRLQREFSNFFRVCAGLQFFRLGRL